MQSLQNCQFWLKLQYETYKCESISREAPTWPQRVRLCLGSLLDTRTYDH